MHLCKFSLITLFVITTSVGLAQNIKVSGSVDSPLKAPIYVTAYSTSDIELTTCSSGKYSMQLTEGHEYILSFSQRGASPKTMSISTSSNSLNYKLKVNATLEKLSLFSKDLLQQGPQKRYSFGENGEQKIENFDLDKLYSKRGFAGAMNRAIDDIKKFHSLGSLPKSDIDLFSNKTETELKSLEHDYGVKIYKSGEKIKTLKQQLAGLKISKSASHLKKCNQELKKFRIEEKIAVQSLEVAKNEVLQLRTEINRKQKVGSTEIDNLFKRLKQKRELLSNTEANQRITMFKVDAKTADCNELSALDDLNSAKKAGKLSKDLKKKELLLRNHRLVKRYKNAKRLYFEHNELAKQATKRDRALHLAEAQKYAAEQVESQLYMSKNRLALARLQNSSQQEIDALLKATTKLKDEAWLARFGYLELVYYLRERPKERQVIDSLYASTSTLLTLPPPRYQDKELENLTSTSKGDESNDQQYLDQLPIEITKSGKTITKQVKVGKEVYTIIITDQNITYSKDGRPITGITYEFETTRKVNEILKAVKNESQKSRVRDKFKSLLN